MFEIKPIDSQVANKISNVPYQSFTMGIIASRGSGKTTLLANLLTKKEFFKDKFNDIIILSPTYRNDQEKWDFICSKNVLVENPNTPKKENYAEKLDKKDKFIKKITKLYDDPDEYPEIIQTVSNNQQNFIDEFGKPAADKILIVLDDVLGNSVLKSKELMKNIANSRHKNLSFIIISQSYFQILKTVRLNITCWILFHTGNRKELDLIYEENNCGYSAKEFEKIFYNITNEPFKFLVINYQNPIKYRLLNSFQTFIIKKISNE